MAQIIIEVEEWRVVQPVGVTGLGETKARASPQRQEAKSSWVEGKCSRMPVGIRSVAGARSKSCEHWTMGSPFN